MLFFIDWSVDNFLSYDVTKVQQIFESFTTFKD